MTHENVRYDLRRGEPDHASSNDGGHKSTTL